MSVTDVNRILNFFGFSIVSSRVLQCTIENLFDTSAKCVIPSSVGHWWNNARNSLCFSPVGKNVVTLTFALFNNNRFKRKTNILDTKNNEENPFFRFHLLNFCELYCQCYCETVRLFTGAFRKFGKNTYDGDRRRNREKRMTPFTE